MCILVPNHVHSSLVSHSLPPNLTAINLMAIKLNAELSHMGKLSEVRRKLRDKCPTFYARRLLSLNFPNDRRE